MMSLRSYVLNTVFSQAETEAPYGFLICRSGVFLSHLTQGPKALPVIPLYCFLEFTLYWMCFQSPGRCRSTLAGRAEPQGFVAKTGRALLSPSCFPVEAGATGCPWCTHIISHTPLNACRGLREWHESLKLIDWFFPMSFCPEAKFPQP